MCVLHAQGSNSFLQFSYQLGQVFWLTNLKMFFLEMSTPNFVDIWGLKEYLLLDLSITYSEPGVEPTLTGILGLLVVFQLIWFYVF